MKPLFCTSILGAILSFLSVASYGQTPITSVPFVISTSGNYIVANELAYSASSGVAITVNAHNVTIDLNGHYLVCTAPNNWAIGIQATNKANIRIRNGEIVRFNTGIHCVWGFSGQNLNFGHAIDTIGFQTDGDAVLFEESTGCVIRNCTIVGGVNGIQFISGNGNRATNNVVTGVGNTGLSSNGLNYFDSNYVDNCKIGIQAAEKTKLRFNTTTNCATAILGGISEFANDQ